MGSIGQSQLSILPKHVTGTPTKLEPHKFRELEDLVHENVTKNPSGHTDQEETCFGERFSMDFNFTSNL